MRKTFVIALIALMVMFAVTSCDNIPIPGGEKPEYTADGRKLVTLTVNIGGTENGRSLKDSLAKSEADFVEVIFKNGSDYFRADGVFPTPIKIKIPADTYTIDDAIVLVGMESGYVLLATGVISSTLPASVGSGFTIDENTTKITFTVNSLEANITAGGGVGKAFKIKEETGTPVAIEDDSNFANKTADGVYGSDPSKNPWFQLPKNTAGIQATLTISGFTATGNNIVIATGGDYVTFTKVTLGAEDLPSLSVTSHAINNPIGPNGEITIRLSTPVTIADSPNRYGIIFNVPVVGYVRGIPDQVTWRIRGGNTSGFDHTKTANDTIPLLVYGAAPPNEYAIEAELDWQ